MSWAQGNAEGKRASSPPDPLEGARYRTLVEGSWVAIVQSDPSGLITRWNEGAERLFGYTPEEATGEPLALLMPKRYRNKHREGLRRYQTGETQVIGETVELHGLRKDGTEFPLELTLDTFTVQGHRYFSGIIRDITERKQAQAELERHARELEESNESWEAFGQAASHDLKEPLRTIASHTELIERRHGDELDETARESLEFVIDAAHHMDALLEGLLEYAKVGTGGERDTVDLNDVVEQALQGLETQRDEHGAYLEVDDLPLVQGSPNQLRQLFQNLISNAFKHSGESPQIRVYAEPGSTGDTVVLCVEDDGVGIPPEEQEEIFTMFRQDPARAAGRGRGSGWRSASASRNATGARSRSTPSPERGPRSRSSSPGPCPTGPNTSPTGRSAPGVWGLPSCGGKTRPLGGLVGRGLA